MDDGGRQILERALIGQPVGESSRRRPHPRRGLGRHRPANQTARQVTRSYTAGWRSTGARADTRPGSEASHEGAQSNHHSTISALTPTSRYGRRRSRRRREVCTTRSRSGVRADRAACRARRPVCLDRVHWPAVKGGDHGWVRCAIGRARFCSRPGVSMCVPYLPPPRPGPRSGRRPAAPLVRTCRAVGADVRRSGQTESPTPQS